jgi:hypothetical protein
MQKANTIPMYKNYSQSAKFSWMQKNTPKKLPKPAIFNQLNVKNALKLKKSDQSAST